MFLALYQQKSTLRKQVKYVAADGMFQDCGKTARSGGECWTGPARCTEGRGNRKDMLEKFAIISFDEGKAAT